jgi:hypothetical protein
VSDIAGRVHVTSGIVRKWITRFNVAGLEGLKDQRRSGRPPTYTAEQMHHMGAVNEVVPHADLERVALQWATEINGKSPQAQRMLKYAFNLLDDALRRIEPGKMSGIRKADDLETRVLPGESRPTGPCVWPHEGVALATEKERRWAQPLPARA